MRKAMSYGCLVVAILYLVGLIGCWGTRRAVRHEPEFYRRVLAVQPERQTEAGDELEQNVLELHNESRKPGYWEATFTEEQVNGWLASDLPAKFPDVLPPGTTDPRVVIETGLVRFAARHKHGSLDTVISLAMEVRLTEQLNTLAFRVTQLHAGIMPLSLSRFREPAESAVRQHGLPVQWSESDGELEALVTIPTKHPEYKHTNIYLESVQVLEGEIHLAGRTEKVEKGGER